jgi:hypothetical protein
MKVLIVCLIPSIGIVQSISMLCSIRALAGHFDRVRSDSTSLERFEGSMSFVWLLHGKSEFVCVWKVSSSCRVRRWTCFVSVETILWFLGLFRVMNRWMRDSLMDSLENIRAYYVSALISNPVLPFYSVVRFVSWYEPINWIFLHGEPW